MSRKFHRIATVRRSLDLGIDEVAARLGVSPEEAARQECEEMDLNISDVLQWQAALDVPLAELLIDTGTRPMISDRQTDLLLKTAHAIENAVQTEAERNIVSTLIRQIESCAEEDEA